MRRAVLIAAALLASAPWGVRAACTEALCDADELDGYFEKLDAARSDRSRRPVHILQIGDSHTAGDAITGGWRELLQARYGGGGRGVLAAGRPYQGYLTRGVTAAMSASWKVSAIYGGNSASPRPPIGVAGFSLTATAPGARLSLTADPSQSFDRVVICAMADRDAGALRIRLGGVETRMALDSPTPRPECRTVEAAAPQLLVEVEAEGAPATITSWGTFRADGGGVVLSNVGVVGSQMIHFARTSDAVIGEELRSYRPDLIVLAWGTNEGFNPSFSPSSFEITLRTQIGRLRRLAGGRVPILLLGAPDASSRQPGLMHNAPGSPVVCPGTATAWTPPAASAPRPASGLDAVIEGLRKEAAAEGFVAEPRPWPGLMPAAAPAPAPVRTPGNPLFAPPGLKATRDIQRRVAHELGIAFWDWSARMGGACAAVKWARGSPPLMRGDYVHFNSAGGREIGRLLQGDLDRAGAALRGGR